MYAPGLLQKIADVFHRHPAENTYWLYVLGGGYQNQQNGTLWPSRVHFTTDFTIVLFFKSMWISFYCHQTICLSNFNNTMKIMMQWAPGLPGLVHLRWVPHLLEWHTLWTIYIYRGDTRGIFEYIIHIMLSRGDNYSLIYRYQCSVSWCVLTTCPTPTPHPHVSLFWQMLSE